MAVADTEIPDPFGLTIAMVVGPYFGDGSYDVIDGNIARARAFAIALANLRIGFFCAHTHTAHFEVLAAAPESFYLALDLRFLSLADCAIFTPGWQQSSGSRREHRLAQQWGLACFYPNSPDDLVAVAAWARARPVSPVLPIISLLAEIQQWVSDLCGRHDLRGWNRADSLTLQRIADIVSLRPTDSRHTLKVLAELLTEVNAWAGDFLAWARVTEIDAARCQAAARLDTALSQAHHRAQAAIAA